MYKVYTIPHNHAGNYLFLFFRTDFISITDGIKKFFHVTLPPSFCPQASRWAHSAWAVDRTRWSGRWVCCEAYRSSGTCGTFPAS